eukprot:3090232-Heterocapsa_arctica.AAC.1
MQTCRLQVPVLSRTHQGQVILLVGLVFVGPQPRSADQLARDPIVARLLVAGRVAVHHDHTDGVLLHAEQVDETPHII